jgi:NADPH2:quinone reductase
MRRVRFHAHGGPEVLMVEETGIPEPGPGQVLIRTEAVGLNYVDVQIRRETSPDSIYFRPVPATLTGDVVGTIERAGPEADRALIGTRAAVLLEDACADYVLADTAWLVPAPEALGAAAASMLPTMGSVALGALQAGRLTSGDTVLITAAAGGIGHLAVQLARQQGAGMVIAAAGSSAKLGFLKELGADAVIDYSDPGWPGQVRAAAPDGVTLALDAVGGDLLHQAIKLLAPCGRVVVYGAASGNLASVPVRNLFRLVTVTGFSLLAWRAACPQQARDGTAELTRLFESGALRAAAETTLPLTDVARAHEMLESRVVRGRIMLEP